MEASPLVSIGLPLALFIIMIGIGMTLTPRDFRQVAVYPRGMVVGTIAQILIMPLVAFAIATLLQLPPALAVGLVIIAACPGGTTSNLFVLLGRGHIALSIVLTVLASLITVATLPFFTNLALDWYTSGDDRISLPVGRTVMTLLLVVLLPVAVGMIFRSKAPVLATKVESIVSVFGALVLAVLVVGIALGVEDLGALLAKAGPAAILLNLAGILIGLAAGRLFSLSPRESLAVAVELGIKNGTIGLMVTITLLGSEDMSVPAAVYGVMMFFFGFALVAYGRKVIPATGYKGAGKGA
ncbi:MAG: bile acid:sodium symporter [Marinobacter sp.]|nr:bile acid:sodium symporter [Marinobacter sp.]